jgi:hypothetical protein
MAFQPGQSGNPGGRPKESPELKAAAREHTEAALAVIVGCLGDDDKRVALKAAEIILDRGHGKPSMTVAGDPEAPMELLLRWASAKS